MADYDFDAITYDNYDTKDISPYELLQQMNSWNKELRFVISNGIEQVETKLEILDGEIRLVVKDAVEGMESKINLTASAIRLEVSNSVAGLNSQLTVMAGNISSKVSATDYNGNTIASLINQSATTITIAASKINLYGAVTVLSDISGNLGSITSGNIDIYNEIKVGGGIHMRSSAFRVIRMGVDPINYGSISVDNGNMTIDAGNSISITAPVNFNNMTVSNLNVTARWG